MTNWWKGRKRSKETIEKMRIAARKRWTDGVYEGKELRLGKHHSDETKKKISKAFLGRKLSEEHKLKISLGLKKGSESPEWKGENAGYGSKHDFIRRIKGKASICSFDSSHESKRFEWANISGSYLRDPDDYVSLCIKCHNEYDFIRKGYALKTKNGYVQAYKNRKVVNIWL